MWTLCVCEDRPDLMSELVQSADISGQSKSLMVFSDNQVLLWQTSEHCVYVLGLRNETHISSVQKLALTDAPLFEVDSLDLNGTGRYLALIGPKGVSIVELPAKWGLNSAFEGGKQTVLCKSWSLNQRFFVCDQDIELLCSRWHPNSPQQQHIVLLTNDNCLRIFDIKEEEVPIHTISLSDANATVAHIGVSRYATSLGDNAVSFDFGPSIAKYYDVDPSTVTNPEECLTPIYVLNGNGDVLLVYSSLKYQYVSNTIFGPLTMRPPAEDNYGVDACSITCLDCVPPVVVIATSYGVLYHCVAIDSNDKPDSQSLLPEPTLYVYETIELPLSLTTSADMQDLACNLKLHKDSLIPTRYFCSHSCGLHVIAVPFVSQLKSTDETAFREEPSIVEHLICTRPVVSPDSDNTTVPLGVALGVQNGYTFVLFLLSSGEMISRRLTPSYIAAMLDNDNDILESDQLSEVSVPKVDFNEYIKQLLKRNASVPLLKSKAGASEDWPQNLQLLTTTTDVLQNEYIKKLDLAYNAIVKRVKVLTNDKHIQVKELDKCMAEKDSLLESYIDLVNKYDESRELQEELSSRIDKVLELLQLQMPELSDAEIRMRNELNRLSVKLKAHQKKLEQIQVKNKYQTQQKMVATSAGTGRPSLGSSALPSPNQIKGIKEMLANQSEQIGQLVESLNTFNINGIE